MTTADTMTPVLPATPETASGAAVRVQRFVGRHSTATLYRGDCLEILRELRGLDCIVTSPPYNQKLDQFKASGMQAEWKVCERMASAYSDSRDETEYAAEQVMMLDLCHDATTETASLFYNHKLRWRDKKVLHPLDIVRASLWELRQEIIWLRDGSMTQNAKMFPPCEERIYWMHKGEWHWNQKANEWMSVWRINSDKKSPHPVGFPVSLPYRAIMATTLPGQTVCDPYMGGGTTGLACLRNGRNFVGIENDNRHFETACEQMRLEIEETLL
jgi:site-specific DNA-methyltransferase (adenine-specific)